MLMLRTDTIIGHQNFRYWDWLHIVLTRIVIASDIVFYRDFVAVEGAYHLKAYTNPTIRY